MKRLLITIAATVSICYVAPLLLVNSAPLPVTKSLQEQLDRGPTPPPQGTQQVALYRTNEKRIEQIELERYVAGVVAAEMPATFEREALKAQALAARTFVYRQMQGDKLANGADVTDTVQHQVYHSDAELKQLWQEDYEWKKAKISEAVTATSGLVLMFKQQPISATFFSTSNGYTERAKDYWQGDIPYLQSRPSPWDKTSPKFLKVTTIPLRQFEAKLNIQTNNGKNLGTITSRTSGKRVGTVKFSNRTWSGRQVRERLGLPSTDFSWYKKGTNIIIQTKGYGHGVGMSQYGANGMAKAGYSVAQIIRHYYGNVQLVPLVKKGT